MRKEINYLGNEITAKGVKPDPKKIDCVLNFPLPKDPTEVILEIKGYYSRFIQNYGHIAKPLTSLLKKDVPFRYLYLVRYLSRSF